MVAGGAGAGEDVMDELVTSRLELVVVVVVVITSELVELA